MRAAVEQGADATLTIVGSVLGDVISSENEADAQGWYGGEGDHFERFVAANRPVINCGTALLNLLVDMGATIDTHLDFDLDLRPDGQSTGDLG